MCVCLCVRVFLSPCRTKESLATGNYLSVVNILMQLRKVCNHPDLFEPRPILSPFRVTGLQYYTASLVCRARDYQPFKVATVVYIFSVHVEYIGKFLLLNFFREYLHS